MRSLTWMHLSDWHQKIESEEDRHTMLTALINDIKYKERIDDRLKEIDFLIISGDIAYSGRKDEYDACMRTFIHPIANALGFPDNGKGRIFMVPGNHDMDREMVAEIDKHWKDTILHDDVKIRRTLTAELNGKSSQIESAIKPFRAFWSFAENFLNDDQKMMQAPGIFVVPHIEKYGKRISVVCLNSAIISAYNVDKSKIDNTKDIYNDYGYLVLGETIVRDALNVAAGSHIVIAVMHHPLSWLQEFDSNLVEERLFRSAHFILHGHKHTTKIQVYESTSGNTIVIPAGASYDRRLQEDPRYISSYNYVHVDLDTNLGTIFFQQWNEMWGHWSKYDALWPEGKYDFYISKKKYSREQQGRSRMPLLRSRLEEATERRVYETLLIRLDLNIERIRLRYPFVRLKLRVNGRISAGAVEKMPLRIISNKRVEKFFKSKGIATNAIIGQSMRINGGKIAPTILDDETPKYIIPRSAFNFEYECESYEALEDIYRHGLLRMADHIVLEIVSDQELEMMYQPIGGFPGKDLYPSKSSDIYRLEVNETCLPGQGFIVQWYPKLQSKHKCSSYQAINNSAKKGGVKASLSGRSHRRQQPTTEH